MPPDRHRTAAELEAAPQWLWQLGRQAREGAVQRNLQRKRHELGTACQRLGRQAWEGAVQRDWQRKAPELGAACEQLGRQAWEDAVQPCRQKVAAELETAPPQLGRQAWAAAQVADGQQRRPRALAQKLFVHPQRHCCWGVPCDLPDSS